MLFKTAAELSEFLDVSGTITFSKIKPTIEYVEESILLPLIGNDLYHNLCGYYDDPTTISTPYQSMYDMLMKRCRKVVGPYTAYYFIPKAELSLSDSGAQRTETANTKTAYAYQIASSREQRLKEGEANLELLLKFITDNISYFEEWANSAEFVEYKSLFIKSGTEFANLYRTTQPYRNYFATRFKMTDVEVLTIEPAITTPLFDYLKGKDHLVDPQWSEAETKLLLYLKKAIAYFTIAEAIPNLSVRIDGNGLTVNSENTVTANKDLEVRKDADKDKIEHLSKNCYANGQSWLKMAINYISSNAALFPSWVAPAAAGKVDLKNDTYTTMFGL